MGNSKSSLSNILPSQRPESAIVSEEVNKMENFKEVLPVFWRRSNPVFCPGVTGTVCQSAEDAGKKSPEDN